MTHEQLDQTGFTVVGKKIEKTTYKEYLQDYGSDETTSPRGVEPRYHIREIKEFLMKDSEGKVIWESEYKELPDEEQDEYGYFAEDVKEYQIWSWGVNGNHPKYTGVSFETLTEAEMRLFDYMEIEINESNNGTPIWHEDYQSALAELADNLQRSVDVVKRYLAIYE